MARRSRPIGGKAIANEGLTTALANLYARTGYAIKVNDRIPEKMTFRQWCQRLADNGMKVDGKPFNLSDRPAMTWIYDQVPSTPEEAYRYTLILMKCAQVGFTVMEMLTTIYLGLKFQPATVGMFLPDMNLAGLKSSERFMPIVRTVPEAHSQMTMEAADGSGRKRGEGNVRARRLGQSLFVFSWTSGRATTESIPMDILSFDEVQEMTLEQMEKTQERLSASRIRFSLMGSTANWPDSDIHHWYKLGTQHKFHTECPTCKVKKPLDDYWPKCVKLDEEQRQYRYVCEQGHWIDDAQQGEWIADNPDADEGVEYGVERHKRRARRVSIHFPQFLSPDISPGEIMESFKNATDMKNFYNRKLGKPYLDPDQVPVTMEHLRQCEDAGIAAGVVFKTRARGTFMGVDQMGHFNVVVIKERLPDGRQAVIHVEEIYDDDPFIRCSELMNQFGVQCCVVESLPNYNDSHRFSKRHRGRVFLCESYGKIKEGMIMWGDTPKLDASDRRTSEESQDRYTVRLDQYKCMHTSMGRITSISCLFPDRRTLTQELIIKGVRQQGHPLENAFLHFTKTALVTEKDEETNEYKRSVKKVGIDPHFSYANMLCDVAWARAHGTATFILPDGDGAVDKVQQAVAKAMPGLPAQVVAMVEAPRAETCGACEAFDDGRCTFRGLLVSKSDPACDFYAPLDES